MSGRLIVTAFILLPLAVVADTSEIEPGERLVEQYVSEMVTLQGRFEQSLVDADGNVLERTAGTLEIQRPGQFRWSYTEPYAQLLIADGLNIWSYDVDLAQVTVKQQQEALANTPALLLSGSSDAMQQFEQNDSFVEAGTTWVSLSPKNTDSGFLRVELGFKHGILDRMVFYDNLEQTTLVALYDVAIDDPIAQDRFQFDVPAGVDVVGTRAVADATDP